MKELGVMKNGDSVCTFHISLYAFLICVILVLAVLIGREAEKRKDVQQHVQENKI